MTNIKNQGSVSCQATAIYGSGDVLLRIGNGGAGATGLIEALALDYLSTLEEKRSIAWVCNHSLNTQIALYRGYIDVAFTYERDREAEAEAEGWSRSAGCAFHDHFCLAGPISDPAGLKEAATLEEAFRKIASQRALFHSRADGSATMAKERNCWSRAGLRPWEDETSAIWYKTSVLNPADALLGAASAGAYLLTDRSTLLRQTSLRNISRITVYREPNSSDDFLMNSCHALYTPQTRPDVAQSVQQFLAYVFSERGQRVVETLGMDTCGMPLFARVRDGFSHKLLRGGMASGARWMEKGML